MNQNIIVVDDEEDFLDSVKRGLKSGGFKNLHLESDPRKVLELLNNGHEPIDLALIDITMPFLSGIDLLEQLKTKSPNTDCIMLTAVNDAVSAVTCLKKGAYDYLVKPVSRDDLLATIRRVFQRRKLMEMADDSERSSDSRDNVHPAFDSTITQSHKVIQVMKEAELHARSDIPVLITGESGTGKDLLAQSIHLSSLRSEFSFTPVNMAALNAGLFEAEFLGHTKGAFTGSIADREGYLARTDKGTLFMDEIGSTPMEFQGKLLRVLQEGEYYKLGASQPKKVNVRFISATNMDIESMMENGKFREDFYYRLKGARLQLPPLRERKEDIPLLISHFLKKFSNPTKVNEVNEAFLSTLMMYHFPGNIRELGTIIQYACNLAKSKTLTEKCLPDYIAKSKLSPKQILNNGAPIRPLKDIEKDYIVQTYEDLGKNKVVTAKQLGIGLNTLRRKLDAYHMD
jgi:DNA-binding NtrC family response regulator